MARTILSTSFEVEGARLKLLLMETGKRLPFRVRVQHKNPAGEDLSGTLAAVEDEETGKEEYEVHLKRAKEMGWSEALRVKLLSSLPPPPGFQGELPLASTAPTTSKRRRGRPRRNGRS